MILLIDLSFFSTNLHPVKEFNALKKWYVSSGLQNWACKLFHTLRNLTRFRITKFGQAVASDSAHHTLKGLTSKFQAQSFMDTIQKKKGLLLWILFYEIIVV